MKKTTTAIAVSTLAFLALPAANAAELAPEVTAPTAGAVAAGETPLVRDAGTASVRAAEPSDVGDTPPTPGDEPAPVPDVPEPPTPGGEPAPVPEPPAPPTPGEEPAPVPPSPEPDPAPEPEPAPEPVPEPGVPSPDAGSDTLPSVEDEAPGVEASSSYEWDTDEGRVYSAAARSAGSYSGKYAAASHRLADSGSASASSAYLALAAITAGGLCIAATRRRGYVAKHAA
ncbi:hypothetical protein PWJ82_09415 [Actinotignum schaalii]|uniref:hypothetical protein n=1 Tax=Actinotignum TaxID=1653174 RepID=UPI00237EA8E8|nr:MULTISPECIES: hypothetical protein [Actinotignum]MDE1566301.1 hypothetical protein [Actinotignum sanguinis]MDE1655440.1 hypothetical protein [Actinotignum schaalii]